MFSCFSRLTQVVDFKNCQKLHFCINCIFLCNIYTLIFASQMFCGKITIFFFFKVNWYKSFYFEILFSGCIYEEENGQLIFSSLSKVVDLYASFWFLQIFSFLQSRAIALDMWSALRIFCFSNVHFAFISQFYFYEFLFIKKV